MDAAAVEDFVVETDDRGILAIAAEIARRSGWATAG
jgi:hypothetical protein